MEKIKFEDYQKMCYSRAWNMARKQGNTHLIDEYISYSHELFCEALNSYNAEKAEFTTHLHYTLRKLSCIGTYKAFQYEVPLVYESAVMAEKKKVFMENIHTLDKNVQKIMYNIIEGVYDDLRERKEFSRFSANRLAKYEGIPYKRARRIFGTIKEWYEENVYEVAL